MYCGSKIIYIKIFFLLAKTLTQHLTEKNLHEDKANNPYMAPDPGLHEITENFSTVAGQLRTA
jgi:hypothetical protein